MAATRRGALPFRMKAGARVSLGCAGARRAVGRAARVGNISPPRRSGGAPCACPTAGSWTSRRMVCAPCRAPARARRPATRRRQGSPGRKYLAREALRGRPMRLPDGRVLERRGGWFVRPVGRRRARRPRSAGRAFIGSSGAPRCRICAGAGVGGSMSAEPGDGWVVLICPAGGASKNPASRSAR
jgi:hypothetical protein